MDEKDVGKVVEGQGADHSEVDNSKRNIMAALMGSLGVAALAGCAGQEGAGDQETVTRVSEAVTGTESMRWVTWIGTGASNGDPRGLNLRDLNGPTHGEVAVVEGFWTPGDGGGGVFFWDADSNEDDDGGTIICPGSYWGGYPAGPHDTGRWKRIYSGPLSVKWFGAVGDGIDHSNSGEYDTQGVQLAIQRACSVEGSVMIPAGRYRCTHKVDVASKCTIQGPGTLYYSHATDVLLNVTGQNVTIDGVHFDGLGATGTATTAPVAVFGSGARNLLVTACQFTDLNLSDGRDNPPAPGTGYVQHAVKLVACDGAVVERCLVFSRSGQRSLSGAAVFVTESCNVRVTDNTISDTGWYSICLNDAVVGAVIARNIITATVETARQWGGSIELKPTTATLIRDVQICDNHISGYHNYYVAIGIEGAAQVDVSGNTIEKVDHARGGSEVTHIGVYARLPAKTPCEGITIRGNMLCANPAVGSPQKGIFVDNASADANKPMRNILIQANQLRSPFGADAFQAGILVNGNSGGGSNIAIVDNIVEANAGNALSCTGIGVFASSALASLTDIVICGNIVKRNADDDGSGNHTGLLVGTFTNRITVQGNTVSGFWYGLYSSADVQSFYRADDNHITGRFAENMYGTSPHRATMRAQNAAPVWSEIIPGEYWRTELYGGLLVTGALLGDIVEVAATDPLSPGAVLTGTVTAANLVKLTFAKLGPSAVTPPGNVNIIVRR